MFYLYMLRCNDNSLYTGITNDPARRAAVHNSGRGAKYTRARRPCSLVHVEEYEDKAAAARREYHIKHALTKSDKEALILLSQKKIVLASASPRRQELLADIAYGFSVHVPEIDERKLEASVLMQSPPDMTLAAEKMCKALSFAKAQKAYEEEGKPEDVLFIGADTAVAIPSEILGKPVDRDDAVRMLRAESIFPQTVVTGVTLIYNDIVKTFSVSSRVIFKKLDKRQENRIQRYADTSEPYDKAGGYGIQKYGDSLVKSFDGDYNNIIGFPVDRIRKEIMDIYECTGR